MTEDTINLRDCGLDAADAVIEAAEVADENSVEALDAELAQAESDLKAAAIKARAEAIDILNGSDACKDVLMQLFLRGPLGDGDIASKSGRDILYRAGVVSRWNGWNSLTALGLTVAVDGGAGNIKDKRDSERELHLRAVVDQRNTLTRLLATLTHRSGGFDLPVDDFNKESGIGAVDIVDGEMRVRYFTADQQDELAAFEAAANARGEAETAAIEAAGIANADGPWAAPQDDPSVTSESLDAMVEAAEPLVQATGLRPS